MRNTGYGEMLSSRLRPMACEYCKLRIATPPHSEPEPPATIFSFSF